MDNNIAYLLLGSNIGDRFEYLSKARTAISEQSGRIFISSGIYETSAWGLEDQEPFLNQAIGIETNKKPDDLLRIIHIIEGSLGRKRIVKWDSRVIDIDILFYNDQQIKSKNLVVPHPLLHLRNFALIPMLEIAPKLIHPEIGKSISELLSNTSDKQEVTPLFST